MTKSHDDGEAFCEAAAEWDHDRDPDTGRCRECGQDVPIQFGATRESSQTNLRTLLKAVASGAVTPEDAARLIESWPTPGGVS